MDSVCCSCGDGEEKEAALHSTVLVQVQPGCSMLGFYSLHAEGLLEVMKVAYLDTSSELDGAADLLQGHSCEEPTC